MVPKDRYVGLRDDFLLTSTVPTSGVVKLKVDVIRLGTWLFAIKQRNSLLANFGVCNQENLKMKTFSIPWTPLDRQIQFGKED